MDEEIYFMPLGGGQSVGASCYYLRIGNKNIILDAGTGIANGLKVMPDTYSLEVSEFIQSMGQIDYVFISHAHMDHIGYLPMMAKQMHHAKIFMTELTASFVEYQLAYRQGLLVRQMMDNVTKVAFMETRILDNIKVTFLPAGHIPGAMMVMLEHNNRCVLYTGDYSTTSAPLTDKCIIPSDKKIDIVIACGLHAKHPYYIGKEDNLFQRINEWFKLLERDNGHILCQVNQLTKGVELLQILNQRNEMRENPFPIYVDKAVANVVHAMERKNISIMKSFNHPALYGKMSKSGFIVSDKKNVNFKDILNVEHIDFSLHDDYFQTIDFIKKINPKSVVFVHVAPTKYNDDECISTSNLDMKSNVLYAEDGMIYKL